MKRGVVIAVFAAFAAVSMVSAQKPIVKPVASESDFTTSVTASVKKRFKYGISLDLTEEVRMMSNSTKFDRLYSVLSLGYAPLNYLSLGGGYAHILMTSSDALANRHRLHFELQGSYKVGNWRFSLRERPELLFRTDNPNPQKVLTANPWCELRSRLMVTYAFDKNPIQTYLYSDLFNTLNAPKQIDNYISRVRNELGVRWIAEQLHSLSFFYRYEWNNSYAFSPVEANTINHKYVHKHMLGLVYSFDWK